MTIRYTDFSAGAEQTYWSAGWGGVTPSYQIKSPAEGYGTYRLVYTYPGGSAANSYIKYNDGTFGSTAETLDIQARIWILPGQYTNVGITARGSDIASKYLLWYNNNGSYLTISRIQSGSSTGLIRRAVVFPNYDGGVYGLGIAQWVRMRFQLENDIATPTTVHLRAKIWKEHETEPAAWQIDWGHALGITAAGYVGLGAITFNTDSWTGYCDYFSIATPPDTLYVPADPVTPVRLTQYGTEVLRTESPETRASQIYVEVLRDSYVYVPPEPVVRRVTQVMAFW